MEKTLNQRMLEDTLSNNRDLKLCEQCKECKLYTDGTPWSSKYDKLHCAVYVRPARKPDGVVDNSEMCKFREL